MDEPRNHLSFIISLIRLNLTSLTSMHIVLEEFKIRAAGHAISVVFQKMDPQRAKRTVFTV